MIEIRSTVAHSLGQQEAVHRLHQMVASLSQRYPQQVHQVQLHFRDYRIDVSFAAYGYFVSWHAEVFDDSVALVGRIPDSAKKFQSKMSETILSQIEAVLANQGTAKAA